jgi:MGT family glycosyltransferase
VLQTLAARTGFPFDEEADLGQWLIPFSYRTLPVLCLNAVELDLPHEPPPNALYVGPMISDPQSDPTLQNVAVEDRSRLNALLEPRRKTVDSRPFIYVAFGAFFQGDDTAFIRQVVSAMADRPDWDVVLGLGARVKSRALGQLPAHIQTCAWAPQTTLLQVANAAIVHAGITTINECISFGVPTVVYPLETNDQMGNAARIAFHGLGVVGDRNRDKADSIRHHVESILADDGCRQRVRAMQARFRAYEGADRGVEAVKALLNR